MRGLHVVFTIVRRLANGGINAGNKRDVCASLNIECQTRNDEGTANLGIRYSAFLVRHSEFEAGKQMKVAIVWPESRIQHPESFIKHYTI
jgi:hypothetical protein